MPKLIDREELRRKIYERFGKNSTKVIAVFEEGRVMTDWAFLEPFLNAMPTIEPEARHGQWVSEKVRKPDWKGVEHDYFQPNSCSVCHTGFAVRTNFCPNCGARMDGGAENEAD